jgi:hypothetical protein
VEDFFQQTGLGSGIIGFLRRYAVTVSENLGGGHLGRTQDFFGSCTEAK